MLFALKCPVQNYAWGKTGLSSSVAQLASATGAIEVDEKLTYAEYWMGTHPNGPAQIIVKGNDEPQMLKEWLKKNPTKLSIDGKFTDGELPYLFKVLSVGKALSIQAHPDIPLAKRLHADRPEIYKDANHKPEMACAITPFEALCGFEAISTVLENVSRVPELASVLNASEEYTAEVKRFSVSNKSNNEEMEKQTLKVLFSALMQSPPEMVKANVDALAARLSALPVDELSVTDTLALRLTGEYPGDVGVFCAYLLCYRTLEPGQAVFLGANEPHAYLKGDCTEIMACSDNVVRAGLTPKLRDVPTLCEMLTYRQPSHEGSEYHPGNLIQGTQRDKNTQVYAPPDKAVTEFEMERTIVGAGDGYAPKPSTFGSVILVLEGEGVATVGGETVELKHGGLFFQSAGSEMVIAGPKEGQLVYFRATKKGTIG